jgi:hypothetical protein
MRPIVDIKLLLLGDVILHRLTGYGAFNSFAIWLLGSQWGHVSLFYDWTKRGLPLSIESIGRGVMIRSTLYYQGQWVKVLRWRGLNQQLVGLLVAKAAERLADNPDSWYDYVCVPRYLLPRLIWYKLTGDREGFGYKENNLFTCAELVAQAFDDAGYPILNRTLPPIPSDFESNLLVTVGEGYLTFYKEEERYGSSKPHDQD